ncbi:SCO family protein [Qipengyuania oceanensis]|uniref:SCO family protein n=1 Tax=Qipengyuania oceanensis TaxID=1463597 RepID=A0A844YLA8_9SPHN|nr:SCO family protein [Qipengyuania oceanensis]MXO63808.1 SCO family protein [Qipengyuania oceanensis]
MNRDAMLRALILSTLLLSALSGCGQGSGPDLAEAPLAGADIGGEFELVNSTGETVRWSDFDGKWRIVYFGYTFCPDICPVDVQRIVRGLKAFADDEPEAAANLVPIFITVDPARDTPEVVGEFTAAFSPQLVGLTGSEEQVKQAADTFRIFYNRGAGTDAGYLMDHSTVTYLFGPDGQPVSTLPTDQGAKAVAAELAKWVR